MKKIYTHSVQKKASISDLQEDTPKLKRKRSTSSIQNNHHEKAENGDKLKKKKKYVNLDQKEDTMQSDLTEFPNKLEDFIQDPKTIEILKKRGVKYLFPIQEQCFKPVSENKDLIGKDKTGSGKTLAFALPLIEKMRKEGLFLELKKRQSPYILALLPTRELAIQVAGEIKTLMHKEGEFRVCSVYGGADIRNQQDQLRDGADIVVGTPGRIMDQYERGYLQFQKLRTVVLDEADQMLQVGFQDDIEKILGFVKKDLEGKKIQHLLFSATIPKWLHDISLKYIDANRVFIDLIKESSLQTPTSVEHLAINCPFFQRSDAMGDVILCYGGGINSRCIIFCETKKEANEIMLNGNIKQDCQVLHGDIPQKQREITFHGFREGKFKCLIATNVASRGLDIPSVDLIVQTEPPKDVDTYIHRAGRTARAGRKGVCITFYNKKHVTQLERIEFKSGIKFKKVGAPQQEDLLKASSRDIVISLKSVSEHASKLFHEVAEELIDELGAKEALQRAIAFISGYTQKMKQRSILGAIEGCITLSVITKSEFRSKGYIWNFLKKQFGEDIEQHVKGMRMFTDNKGACFDLEEVKKPVFDEYIQKFDQGLIKFGHKIEITTALPDLVENIAQPSYNNSYSNGYSNYNSYNNNNHRSSYNSTNNNNSSSGGNSYQKKDYRTRHNF